MDEELMFSIVLFCVYFGFYSWLITPAKPTKTVTTTKQKQAEKTPIAPLRQKVKLREPELVTVAASAE